MRVKFKEHNSPVFDQVVLQRISRQNDAASGPDGFEALSRGSVAILDAMSLVANDQIGARTRQCLTHLKKPGEGGRS